MNRIFADVILFDTVGTPYDGNTVNHLGMGGSEWQSILLLEQFSKQGLKVICLNNLDGQSEVNGVLYISNKLIHQYEWTCKTLIIHRFSNIPSIKHKKCVLWSTDLNNFMSLRFLEHLNNKNIELVVLSDFHRTRFSQEWNIHTIPFMIPDWIYNYSIPSVKKDYVYASSMMKGYDETINYWSYLKSNNYLGSKKLKVCLPGYDNISENLSIPELSIEYLGTLPLSDVVKTIAHSEGLFYINTVPETFCLVVVLCEILGTPPYVYCQNHIGALDEVINTKTATYDVKRFIEYFKNETHQKLESAKNYRPNMVMPLWNSIITV